jgi:hypothetical protein
MAYSGVADRQSYVSSSGREWEDYVMRFINDSFEKRDTPLHVIHGKAVKKDSRLWRKLAIPITQVGAGVFVEGDLDLVVVSRENPEEPLAVISCKTSLHGRFSETLFYALVWKKMLPALAVVFATPDKGRQARKGVWESEWGTTEKPTKDRLLAEEYLDGVYVANKKTHVGGKIRRVSELPRDLEKWSLSNN